MPNGRTIPRPAALRRPTALVARFSGIPASGSRGFSALSRIPRPTVGPRAPTLHVHGVTAESPIIGPTVQRRGSFLVWLYEAVAVTVLVVSIVWLGLSL